MNIHNTKSKIVKRSDRTEGIETDEVEKKNDDRKSEKKTGEDKIKIRISSTGS